MANRLKCMEALWPTGLYAIWLWIQLWVSAVPSVEAKKSMMKLAHRLVMDFCASFSASVGNKWTMLSGINDDLRVTLHRTDSSLPHGVVLSAATSIWLPLPRDRVFSFLKDEQNRPQVALQLHETSIVACLSCNQSLMTSNLLFIWLLSVGRVLDRKQSAKGCSHYKRFRSRKRNLYPSCKFLIVSFPYRYQVVCHHITEIIHYCSSSICIKRELLHFSYDHFDSFLCLMVNNRD